MDANEIAKKVSQSSGEVTELKAAVRQLQARLDRHALVIQVLKDMLLSRGGGSQDEFLQRLERATADKLAPVPTRPDQPLPEIRVRPVDRGIDGRGVIPPEGGHHHGPSQSAG